MGNQLDDGFHEGAMNPTTCCPVLELRQYTLHPGMRDVLIELFEREFIESQEALGMTLVGQFRDLDNPDRFVWLRGFADMETRARALGEFYGGPVWKAHREAANETMIDSDNVLLLRPARPDSGFALEGAERQPPGAKENPPGLVVAMICHLQGDGNGEELADSFENTIRSESIKAGRIGPRLFRDGEASEYISSAARARVRQCRYLVFELPG